MRIRIKNIGIVANADVQIDGISVIAGKNGTGKSTISKALYAAFNGFNNYDQRVERERETIVLRYLRNLEMDLLELNKFPEDLNSLLSFILKNKENYTKNPVDLEKKLTDFFGISSDEQSINTIKSTAEKIIDTLKIEKQQIILRMVARRFDSEFGGQVKNVYNEDNGEITLTVRDDDIRFTFSNSTVSLMHIPAIFEKEAIYIDASSVLDENIYRVPIKQYNHRSELTRKLFSSTETDELTLDTILSEIKLKQAIEIINSASSGHLTSNNKTAFGYELEDGNIIDIKNTSEGLKTFAIIKALLLSGEISENGLLILDEPEIHLHPEWQLLFAEAIILIQKAFNLHILLSTHSPYFLRAIQVYAKKHEVDERCNYYLSESSADGNLVTNVGDNIELIYKQLSVPLQQLASEEWS